jgi:hypothetical protein
MMKKLVLVCAVAVLVFSFESALAGRYWYHSQVIDSGGNPIGGGNTAIGMRSGGAYPVVASNQGTAAMLPGFWAEGPMGFAGELIDADTSADGQVIFAGTEGQVGVFGPGGWGVASYPGQAQYKASAAFDNEGNPAVLHKDYNQQLTLTMRDGSSWYSTNLGQPSDDSYALDFDSMNNANVVFNDGAGITYGVKGSATASQWQFSQPVSSVSPMGLVDLVLTENDVPYLFYTENQFLKYAVHIRQTGSWTTGILDQIEHEEAFCAAPDKEGGIGIAYIADDMTLSFISSDGQGAWTGPDRLTCPDGLTPEGIGLTYDYENNPVISYNSATGTWIAYDPEVTPEPATIAMLGMGGLALFVRRK